MEGAGEAVIAGIFAGLADREAAFRLGLKGGIWQGDRKTRWSCRRLRSEGNGFLLAVNSPWPAMWAVEVGIVKIEFSCDCGSEGLADFAASAGATMNTQAASTCGEEGSIPIDLDCSRNHSITASTVAVAPFPQRTKLVFA